MVDILTLAKHLCHQAKDRMNVVEARTRDTGTHAGLAKALIVHVKLEIKR
jgi:hypothetical protein